MSKKRKTTLQAPSTLTLKQIRAFTPLEFSKYTKKQLRVIEKKVIKSQNDKLERIYKEGFGRVGRIRDYVKKGKNKITSAPKRTNKDPLINRIMALNQLTTDKFTSVKTISKGYDSYYKGNKRYGDTISKEQYSDIANVWIDFRANRFSFKITSEQVYNKIQEYITKEEKISWSKISKELQEEYEQKDAILKEEEKTVRKSPMSDTYSPKDL